MNFNIELDRVKNILDKEFEKILTPNSDYELEIIDAIKYSIFTGGKRIRPVLCLKSFELFSENDYDKVLPFAMGLEMIHTYSLIHDDLPAMDDDDYRRGLPTSHIKYGEAMAILAGDGLLNMAYEIILSSIEDKNDILAAKKMAKYAGITGMIGGQVVDLHLDETEVDGRAIEYMYRNKTAALIQAGIVCGSIVGGANEEEISKMEEFGYHLGMAYQIKDDFLDLEEDESIDKITYISFHGKERSSLDLSEHTRKSIEILNDIETNNKEFFIELIQQLENREI